MFADCNRRGEMRRLLLHLRMAMDRHDGVAHHFQSERANEFFWGSFHVVWFVCLKLSLFGMVYDKKGEENDGNVVWG